MTSEAYSLEDVLAVARAHPFYATDIRYPPDTDSIGTLCKTKSAGNPALNSQRLLTKTALYNGIQRLVDDTCPQNSYRRGVYTSVTGGGLGDKPLFFATDVHENRRQRASFGRFLAAAGIIKDHDWVVTRHCSGELYRSLDLLLEILENAGASVLGAGHIMSCDDVVQLMLDYHVNVLCGDSGQIVQMVHHISTMAPEKRRLLKLDKIIYTSEVLTAAQRLHIKEILGSCVEVCSILGSAEAGPWAVSSPSLSGREATTSAADFFYDTRDMLIEIMAPEHAEGESNAEALPEGERGIIVQTSLRRLRHPLVRYVTGDVGSLHPLPESARAVVAKEDWPYLKMLRLDGRDRRFSFDWDGNYFQFSELTAMMNREDFGLLQWQAVLYKMEPSQESGLEIRLLSSMPENEEVEGLIRNFFHVGSFNEHRFKIVYVDSLDAMVKSTTGRKVIKFVDRYY